MAWSIDIFGQPKKHLPFPRRYYFDIYLKETRPSAVFRGSELVVMRNGLAKCDCGRAWDDNPSKTRFQRPKNEFFFTSPENLMRLYRSPVLCMVCFYLQEEAAGRWAPDFVASRKFLLDP